MYFHFYNFILFFRLKRLEIELEIIASPSISDAALTALAELPCILEQVGRPVNQISDNRLITCLIAFFITTA